MSTILNEILALITKFKIEERKELVQFLFASSVQKIEKGKEIGKKELLLALYLCQYLKNSSKADFLNYFLNTKILFTRALILDLVDTTYEEEQWAIHKPESWIKKIIGDIKLTFMIDPEQTEEFRKTKRVIFSEKFTEIEDIETFIANNQSIEDNRMHPRNLGYQTEDLLLSLEIYNIKLMEELQKIFFGREPFGKKGNQFVLNLMFYKDNLNFLEYNFDEILEKAKNQISEKNRIPQEKLDEIYADFQHKKSRKRNK